MPKIKTRKIMVRGKTDRTWRPIPAVGSGLPEITDDDEGKVLTAVDGAAQWAKAPDVDDTLKVSGAAADAAKVGTELSNLSEAIGDETTARENAVSELGDRITGLSQIETPQIVSSVEEMTDTTKHYVLNGSIWAYRTTVTEGETVLVPNFTNLIKFDADGNPTNVTLNQRYSSSAGAAAGYLAGEDGSFAITDATAKDDPSATVFYISQQPVGQSKCAGFASDGTTLHSNGIATVNAADVTNGENGEYKVDFSSTISDAPMVKFSAQMEASAITADRLKGLIVTLNEPITYTEQITEGGTVSEWYDTGISYAPTFKTDLIGVLGENNVIYLSENLPSGTYTLKYGDETYDTIGTITVE